MMDCRKVSVITSCAVWIGFLCIDFSLFVNVSTGVIDQSQVIRLQAPGEFTCLSRSNLAPIDLRHGDDFTGSAGEEDFVGGIKIPRGEPTLCHWQVKLRGELQHH